MDFSVAQADNISVTNLCEVLFTKEQKIHVRASVDGMKKTYKYFLYLDNEEKVVLQKI